MPNTVPLQMSMAHIEQSPPRSLLNELDYFQYRFPCPQYLGCKKDLLGFINEHIPQHVKTSLDAFAGSQSVAYLLKQRGHRVITNDFLSASYRIGMSLIENKNSTLTKRDVEMLFSDNKDKKHLMERIFTDLFF